MILHLVNDEKIINRTIDLFEDSFSGRNLFVVVTSRKNFRFVATNENVIGIKEFLKKKETFSFSIIIIHSLSLKKIDLLNQLKIDNTPIYWIIWGADLYNKLLEPRGFQMYSQQNYYFRKLWWKVIWNRTMFFFTKRNLNKTVRFIEKKVDFIVTDTTENDYNYLILFFPQLRNKPWRDFFYYPIDVILDSEMINDHVRGDDIMIGNSASMTNNHEYAMSLLSKLDLRNRKLVVPLSYSGKHGYVAEIVRYGTCLFGDSFYPLLKFVPLQEYNSILININVAIFANWRQEAIGNIIISLYLGAKVFISSRNPVFEWARIHKLTIYELESITQEELDTPLCEKSAYSNRKILLELYNRKRFLALVEKLIDEVQ